MKAFFTSFGQKIYSGLNSFFRIEERGSSLGKELLGGLTTFLAMFYILPVNGFMLGGIEGATPGAIFAATAISACIATLLMGLYANFPVALAPGMGINAMITYTVCSSDALGYSYGEALALTFVSGVIFVLISITPLRKMILNAIPKNLKIAIGAGIGFFIAFIGLKNAGIVVSNSSTAVALGDFTLAPVLVAVAGIILVLILASVKNKWISSFAVVISLFVMGILAATLGQCGVPNLPTFSTENVGNIGDIGKVFGLCFIDGFQVFTKPEAYAILFALLFVDFFDTAGTLVAVGEGAGIIDEDGQIKNSQRALLVDAVGTVAGSVLGTSTVTSFVESTTGISVGARTGLSSVVVGLLMIVSLGLYPALGMFSSVMIDGVSYSPVTSLALVYVGTLMFKQLKNLDWDDILATISGFFTIIMMVLAYSISDGIAFGFITYCVVALASGRGKKVSPIMYIIALLFIVLYVVKALVL